MILKKIEKEPKDERVNSRFRFFKGSTNLCNYCGGAGIRKRYDKVTCQKPGGDEITINENERYICPRCRVVGSDYESMVRMDWRKKK